MKWMEKKRACSGQHARTHNTALSSSHCGGGHPWSCLSYHCPFFVSACCVFGLGAYGAAASAPTRAGSISVGASLSLSFAMFQFHAHLSPLRPPPPFCPRLIPHTPPPGYSHTHTSARGLHFSLPARHSRATSHLLGSDVVSPRAAGFCRSRAGCVLGARGPHARTHTHTHTTQELHT